MTKKKTFGFNWRESPAHIWFLSTFLKMREADDDFLNVPWALALGESPENALRRFCIHGVVHEAPFAERLAGQFSRDALREMLRQRALPTAGTKDELVWRLIEHADAGLYQQVTLKLYRCTDYGRRIAEAYLADPVPLLPEAEAQAEALSRDDVRRTMRWLLTQGVILGVAGNAVYDLLKSLGAEVGDLLPRLRQPPPLPGSRNIMLSWCRIPAGRFWMGSSERDRDARSNEKPQHPVYLPDYHISQYPVTCALYRLFVQATGQKPPSYWDHGRYPTGRGNHPVVNVSWYDANAFCEWLSRRLATKVRLPTEAEWEKAARGTDGRIYPWGNWWDPSRCNSDESGIRSTTPVDRYPSGKSPYDVFDMVGNAWEWTHSIYKPYPYDAGDGRENAASKEARSVRGGSWIGSQIYARAAGRDGDLPYNSYNHYGFRVVSPVF